MTGFQTLVEQKLTPSGVSGDSIIYPCPVCEDLVKGHHLYVDFKKNMFHCVRCGYGGRSLLPLLRKLGIDIKYDYEDIKNNYAERIDKLLKDTEKTEQRVVEFSKGLKPLTQYFEFHTKPLSNIAYNYLKKRGLTVETIDRLRIREGVDRRGQSIWINDVQYKGRDYSNRIVIPSIYDDDLISYYVARDYSGLKQPKYLNPPQELAYASEDVWNLRQVNSNIVIVCEGVFTALTAGGSKLNAVATYGKSVATAPTASTPERKVLSQGEKLLLRRFDCYYMCYDADALKESLQTAKYLHDRGAYVKVIIIDPKKYGQHADANSIGYNEFLKLMSEAREYTPFLETELQLGL